MTTPFFPELADAHLQALRSMGATERQLFRLNEALPVCASALIAAPPMADVRDEIVTILARLQAAEKSVRKLLEVEGRPRARSEARARIQIAGYETQSTGQLDSSSWDTEMEHLLQALAPVLASTQHALDGLPKVKRTHKAGDPLPVWQIHRALMLGWGETHHPVRESDDFSPIGTPPPKYPFPPSSSETSAFREVVRICYGAFRPDDERDPERAIKAFLKQQKKLQVQQREEIDQALSKGGTEAS